MYFWPISYFTSSIRWLLLSCNEFKCDNSFSTHCSLWFLSLALSFAYSFDFVLISILQISHFTLVDNRIKQFRYKLIHNIIATNEILFTWKTNHSPYCHCCNELETLEHCYIGLTIYKSYFWSERITKLCNISKQMTDELRLLDI